MPETYARPTQYEVSVWPDGHECEASYAWKLTVEYRGDGNWAVTNGSRICLGRDGSWDWESIPPERADEWIADHRFTRDEALALAREHAPNVKVNGKTAAEILAKHQAEYGDGPCSQMRIRLGVR